MGAQNWPVIGHNWAVERLAGDLSRGRARHAYLFTGPAGIGKRTLASAFAQAALCVEENPPCGDCRICKLITDSKHPDVSLVTPITSGRIIKKAKITIEQIRALIRDFTLHPVEARRRVALCTDFEAATPAAANALLKTLEEPPGKGIIILTANSEEALLPTIVSRCERLTLRPLSRDKVQQALKTHWGAEEDQAAFLASLSNGRLGWAAHLLEDCASLERRSAHLESLRQMLPAVRRTRFDFANSLAQDRETLLEALEVWQGWWRDVYLAGAGTAVGLMNINYEKTIRRVAEKVSPAEAAQAIRSITHTLEQLQMNANTRLAVEVLLLKLPFVTL